MNESAKSDVAKKRPEFPLRNLGRFDVLMRSRIPAMMTIESKKPPALPKAYTMDWP